MQPDNRNSFDALRLAAAVMVFHSHMFALKGLPEEPLPWLRLLWSGVGLGTFFVISGYLVTNSVLRRPDLLQFLGRRAVRIMPGLTVNVLFCVLLGAAVTTLSVRDYFAAPQTFEFLRGNVLLAFQDVQYNLPGVFSGNPSTAVNGSLWTLPYEIALYFFVGFVVWATRNSALRATLAVLGFAGCFSLQLLQLSSRGINYEIHLWTTLQTIHLGAWGGLFFLGALMALAKDLRRSLTVICAAAAILFWGKTSSLALMLLLGGLVIAVGESKALRLPQRMGDLSYGIYLYAFPVQQAVVMFIEDARLRTQYPMALAITFVLAYLSWRLVESPAMRLKGGLPRWLGRRSTAVP